MGIRVLVVDDDKDLLTLIEKFLVKEQPDFEVVSTISAQDAVRKVEEEHFDAIVCDYYLGPGEMNGLELLEWLRASNSTIPFIMFTGRSREEVAIRALNLGADLYPKKDQEDLGNLFVELVHHIKSSVESVQMQKTLWEERSRFQKYLDVARVMILALDSDGKVTLVNRRGCEILGYDLDEIIGKDWFKTFLPKRLRKETYDLFRSLTKGKVGPAGYSENLVLTKNGEERIIAWHYTVLTDESGIITGTLSSGEDITERKRAEEALRQSKQRYYDLLMTLPEGVGITDLDENFTYVNKALSDMLDYPVEELVQKNVLDLTPADGRRKIKAETERRKRNGTSTYELQMIRKDGELVLLEVSALPQKDNQGNVIGTIGVTSNITKRKQAEEALRDSESMFRSLFEQAPMGVARVGLDGAILQGNSSLALMLGYDTDELVGINVFDISTPEDEKIERRFSQELLQGTRDSYKMERRFIRKDGDQIWGILSVSVVSNSRGEPIFTIRMVENITPRKKAEEALRVSEKRFRTVFEQAAVGVSIVELDDYIIEANPFFQELIGYSADELVTMKVADFAHPDDTAIDASLMREVLDGKRDSYTMEKRYIRKTGEEIRGNFSANFVKNEEGIPEFCIGIIEDITERKLAEVNLRLSEKKYHSIFDNTPVGLTFQEIVVDESGNPIDFVFIDVNEGFEALMGLRKDDIIGKSASHVLTSSGEPTLEWIDVYGKVALTGARARFDQYSEALGRWFSVTAYSPEKNFFITAYTDITEQKKGYENLKQQKKELSDFAHMMSHDLSSYFFKIRGSILLLGSNDEFPEIRGIKLLTEVMIDLVQHSVALADAGLVIDKKHKVNLDHLVRDIAMRYLPEGIALMQGPLQSVMADEIKLIQIFQNLFDNAVEHGSPTTVEVQRYDSKKGVRIVVANDGKSIPIDSRPKVFQRGFTTKDKRKGYGLSIVKKLVEAHGWQIKLVDTPETAFEILIPSAAG